jgi:autotransporter passenger strand-loop-strand repeat protein
VSGGQSVAISSGQAGDDDTILNGGTETVDHGGVSRRPVIDGGLLFDDGFVDRALVSGGGVFFDSGFAYRATMDSGSIMYVEPDGKARRTVVDSGGTVYDGGTANRTTVNSGGIVYVGGALTISGMTSDFVGSANGTVIRGGTEYVLSGTDTNARIGNGGFEYVDSGGTAVHTMIRHGGELVVSSGGVAEATVIGRGGLELVMSGGVGSGAIVDRGGTLEFAAADTGIAQDIRFSDVGWGAAVVKFDAAATTSGGLIYDGVISGFDSPDDEIDLAGLGFVSGQTTATSVLSGSNTILTITNGTQTVALTLAGDRTSGQLRGFQRRQRRHHRHGCDAGRRFAARMARQPRRLRCLGPLRLRFRRRILTFGRLDRGPAFVVRPGTDPTIRPSPRFVRPLSGRRIRCRMASPFGAGHGFVRRQHWRSLPARPDSAARPSLAERAAPGGETCLRPREFLAAVRCRGRHCAGCGFEGLAIFVR